MPKVQKSRKQLHSERSTIRKRLQDKKGAWTDLRDNVVQSSMTEAEVIRKKAEYTKAATVTGIAMERLYKNRRNFGTMNNKERAWFVFNTVLSASGNYGTLLGVDAAQKMYYKLSPIGWSDIGGDLLNFLYGKKESPAGLSPEEKELDDKRNLDKNVEYAKGVVTYTQALRENLKESVLKGAPMSNADMYDHRNSLSTEHMSYIEYARFALTVAGSEAIHYMATPNEEEVWIHGSSFEDVDGGGRFMESGSGVPYGQLLGNVRRALTISHALYLGVSNEALRNDEDPLQRAADYAGEVPLESETE